MDLPELASKWASSVIYKFERKKRGSGEGTMATKVRKIFTLCFLNEDVYSNIRIIKSLESSSMLLDGVFKIIKHEIKKTKKLDFLLSSPYMWLLHWQHLWFRW